MNRFPDDAITCPKCKQKAMIFPPRTRERFYKVCLNCGAMSHRMCPHDEVKCEHECDAGNCWRELEGS